LALNDLSGGIYLFQFYNSKNDFLHQFKMIKL
jgi:hypothetical protein